jgi:tetratricopeptide (TPR) repeat protein
MKSIDLVASTAAVCLLALTSVSALLSQDAVAPAQQGLQLVNQGHYREAEQHLLLALGIAGPANATAIYNLASLYQRQGRLPEAERLHRLALDHIERVRGPFDPAVAQSLNDLGALYRSLAKYSRAIDHLERAVQILNQTPSLKIACSVFNNLAITYYDVAQYAKANTFARRALAIAESGDCEDASDLGYILNSIGLMHLRKKKYTDAQSALRKAALTFAGTLGSQHPDYAIVLTNLARTYQRQKRFREALPLLESARDILEHSFGPEAPILASTLQVSGEVMKALGLKSAARLFLQRARSISTPAAGTVDIMALSRQPQEKDSR